MDIVRMHCLNRYTSFENVYWHTIFFRFDKIILSLYEDAFYASIFYYKFLYCKINTTNLQSKFVIHYTCVSSNVHFAIFACNVFHVIYSKHALLQSFSVIDCTVYYEGKPVFFLQLQGHLYICQL